MRLHSNPCVCGVLFQTDSWLFLSLALSASPRHDTLSRRVCVSNGKEEGDHTLWKHSFSEKGKSLKKGGGHASGATRNGIQKESGVFGPLSPICSSQSLMFSELQKLLKRGKKH